MSWIVHVPEVHPQREAADEAQLEHGDGRISVAGAPAVDHPSSNPGAKAPGLFGGSGPDSDLLALPDPSRLGLDWRDGMEIARELDLRAGVLRQLITDGDAQLEVASFCCLARPGTYVLRAEGDASLLGDAPPLRPPAPADPEECAQEVPAAAGLQVLTVSGNRGGAVAAATQDRDGGRLDRFVVYETDPMRPPGVGEAVDRLAEVHEAGFERLLAEQQRAWAQRWEAADVRIEGDDDLQLAARFSLFHVAALVASDREAALGARGTTGAAYRGHVFWDADVFVLPLFAATHPAAARAMLRYRALRLPAARAYAARNGRAGARFPWESATSGEDVTPSSMIDPAGEVIRVVTGELEEHITADVAWAAAHYLAWTGDERFARVEGLALLVETARYWASRVEPDEDGSGHIRHVIGPDEYHEGVDDSAYTNVMARWNLRAAAAHVERYGDAGLRDEARSWLQIADTIVDGYDAASGLYEEFDGFFALEPVIAAELAQRPFSGPAVLGYEATRGAQVVKQTDVLLLHLNVPEEVAPGSLAANVAFYEPRTTHESSLSPGASAEALARAGRPDDALPWLRLTAMMDMPDFVPVPRAGLHTAALGNTWRALAYGFMGVWPGPGGLQVHPQLPTGWDALEVRVRYRGTPVRLLATHADVTVECDAPLEVAVRGREPEQVAPGIQRFDL